MTVLPAMPGDEDLDFDVRGLCVVELVEAPVQPPPGVAADVDWVETQIKMLGGVGWWVTRDGARIDEIRGVEVDVLLGMTKARSAMLRERIYDWEASDLRLTMAPGRDSCLAPESDPWDVMALPRRHPSRA